MNVQERMKMIDNKVENDLRKKKEEEENRQKRIDECKETIRSLHDRIQDLLKFAWYAMDNGINLTGIFFSDSWSHLVGIKNRDYLGITKGGDYGNIDFYTDGNEIYGFDTRKYERVEPLLKDMEIFIARFDELEKTLYKYIEDKCK